MKIFVFESKHTTLDSETNISLARRNLIRNNAQKSTWIFQNVPHIIILEPLNSQSKPVNYLHPIGGENVALWYVFEKLLCLGSRSCTHYVTLNTPTDYN